MFAYIYLFSTSVCEHKDDSKEKLFVVLYLAMYIVNDLAAALLDWFTYNIGPVFIFSRCFYLIIHRYMNLPAVTSFSICVGTQLKSVGL